MQQCGDCLRVYDESEYCHCPYCAGILDDDFDDYEEDDSDYLLDENTPEEILRFNHIISNYPGVFDDDAEYIRCPSCGTGLRNVDGTITCPRCGPV